MMRTKTWVSAQMTWSGSKRCGQMCIIKKSGGIIKMNIAGYSPVEFILGLEVFKLHVTVGFLIKRSLRETEDRK